MKKNGGVIWIWAVCFLSIIVYSIVWFSLVWPAMSVIETVQAAFTFPSAANLTITFMVNVIAWHPIFFILGMLLWAYVNSQRREVVSYPEY